MESFLTVRLDQDGITKATYNRHLAALKTVFKMAVRWGLLAHNPAQPIRTLREEPTIPRALSDAEVVGLLAHLPEHARVVAIVALDSGRRRSELFGLQWTDVDFERQQITVTHSKNGTFRVIPMTQRVYETLQEQRQKGVIPYVLPSKAEGGKGQDIREALDGAGKRSGIGHVTQHQLRHTFASRLRDKGVPLDRIKELLGHKTMVMTLRYAQANPVQLREAIEALQG